jgi:hypothetical protein
MLQVEDIQYAGLPPVNVNTSERWGSIMSGALMLLYGITRKSLTGAALALGGAYFLFRGITGHCYVYELLGFDLSRRGDRLIPADEPPPPSVEKSDEVVESSWESFPTSDPPAWTMGRRENQS